MRPRFVLFVACLGLAAANSDLEKARDRQDRAALSKLAGDLQAEAGRNANDAAAQYQFALAESYLSEAAMEQRDRNQARAAAEAGIAAAQKAVSLEPRNAEYHRILGTLCGQVIPANVLLALKYAKCAQESVNKAVELDPKSSSAYLSRGVGNYYLPAQFGGGVELAIKDFEKAIELNPKSAEAYLWLGIAERKLNRNAEARKALQKAVELNPARVWARQQLEKTPAQ